MKRNVGLRNGGEERYGASHPLSVVAAADIVES